METSAIKLFAMTFELDSIGTPCPLPMLHGSWPRQNEASSTNAICIGHFRPIVILLLLTPYVCATIIRPYITASTNQLLPPQYVPIAASHIHSHGDPFDSCDLSVCVCVSVRCYRIKCCPCERETRISYVSITVEQRTCTGALSPVELPNVIEHGFLTSIHEFCGTHEDRIRPIVILCVWNASECVYAMCALQSRPPEP